MCTDTHGSWVEKTIYREENNNNNNLKTNEQNERENKKLSCPIAGDVAELLQEKHWDQLYISRVRPGTKGANRQTEAPTPSR